MPVTVEAHELRRIFRPKNQAPVVALDGVDLEVNEGEIFGMLGPNGAGKTTTIRILSTLLLPTGGWARVNGYDVAKEPDKVRRVINMASGAEKAGYDFITTRRNLWFFSQLYGIPTAEAEKRIDELAEMLGLSKFLDRKFYALSTGYRQRATIARGFINEPKVVFLDEPTIGLDVMTALSIREFLKAQAREKGRTIILATHNMSEAESICDRVAIIDRGKIIAMGKPDALKRSLGAPPLVMEVQPPPRNLDLLASLPDLRGYTLSVDDERGLATVQVVVGSDSAASAAIETMKKAGFNVLTSWRRSPTIEEVFVSLVGKGFKEREEQE